MSLHAQRTHRRLADGRDLFYYDDAGSRPSADRETRDSRDLPPMPAGARMRRDPLTGEWVLVSPHRTKRPWQGKQESPAPDRRPEYDPACYLCPGNVRAGGEQTPPYEETYVFTNDFAALLDDTPAETFSPSPRVSVVPRGRARSRPRSEGSRRSSLYDVLDRPDVVG